MHAYTESESDVVASWHRTHANSEQTHVYIVECGERYVVLVADVDPTDFQPMVGEIIAYDPTMAGAREQAERWMETHAKGILGDESDSDGILSSLWGAIQSVDQSAKQNIGVNDD